MGPSHGPISKSSFAWSASKQDASSVNLPERKLSGLPEGEEFDLLQDRINYRFGDPTSLVEALTHSSALELGEARVAERLEHLGDSVVGLAVTDLLFARYPEKNEGDLSKLRAQIVRTSSFAHKARELKLDRCLTLGRSEERNGGREKESVLADAYEALLGAIFLESSYDRVRDIVSQHFAAEIEEIEKLPSLDSKTRLQELFQELYRKTPEYRLVEETGPDHDRTFIVEVCLDDKVLARGEGKSKRRAEQEAARLVLLSEAEK